MNLNLYDKNLNRIAIIGGQYVSCFWSEGYNTIENFSIELIATDDYKEKIAVDCYVGRSDRKTLMVIKTVEIAGGKIVVSGKQAARVLDDVSFLGTISSGSEISNAIKTSYDASEKYRSVECSSAVLGVFYPHQISNKSFAELCKTMCQSEDIGFRIIRDGSVALLEFYQPEAKENLVFSEKFGNLTVDALSISSANYKNYAIVLGEGEGDNRTRVDVDLTDGEERRDLIVDAKDLQMNEGESEESYKARLTARGIEKLLERTQTFSCAFTPYSGDFGIKYDLGDILTVYLPDYGITLRARVSKFSQKAQNNKIDTTVEVGQITIKR